MFYCYRQNKINNTYVVNDNVTLTVLIEANSDQEADLYAEKLGISFDSFEDDDSDTSRWDSAKGYISVPNPDTFIRGSQHYDLSNVAIGEVFCYVYDSAGQKQSFVREQ
jgi:hypothetical protein